MHKHGQTRAGADEHRLKAEFLYQLVDGDGPADHHVGFDLDAQVLQPVHFLLHDGLGQTELWDAIHQHATGQVQRLVHRHLVALPGQVTGAGEARGAGADDGHLVAVRGGALSLLRVVLVVPVGHEPLQAADAHALVLDAPDALALALGLLGADPAAHGGQGAVGGDDLIGGLEVALRHLGNELRNMDLHRAATDTGHILAVEASSCLIHGLLLGVAQGHLVEIPGADYRVLVGHGILLGAHIRCHLTSPPA